MSQKQVPGCGPPHARIAIVGEAPGETEELLGLPFVGASGKFLNDYLQKAGIQRAECYLTNVMKTRPPSNNFGAFYADPQRNIPTPELHIGIKQLHDELRSVNPNVILCLGAEPLRALTAKRNITNWRGSILASPVGKCIATFHPSFILRSDFSDAPTFQLDLRRVKAEANSASLDLPQFHFEINPSFERVCEFLRTRPKRLAVDIETTGNLVRCIGFADSSRHAICVPFARSVSEVPSIGGSESLFSDVLLPEHGCGPSRWSQSEEWEILRLMYDLLADPNTRKVLQNFPFDSTILARELGLHIAGLHMDTLLAQHTCHPELLKSLEYQASIYTRIPYWKDHDASSDTEEWRYNCFDCCATFEISEVHDLQLRNLGLAEFYRNHVQPSSLALTRAQNRGVLVDEKVRGDLARKAHIELEEVQKKLREITGELLNPNSSDQMQTLLYGKLKLPVQLKRDPKTKQMRPTCDEDALNKLMKKFPEHRPLLMLCIDYRERVKALSTYLEKELTDGRAFTSYAGTTVTGRVASSGKVVPRICPREGFPLQQIPRGETRRCFISPPGWVFIKSDLKQADFWAVMAYARVTRLLDRLDDPEFDVHRWNAAGNIFKCSERDITKAQRAMSKVSIHGTNYGMQPEKAASLRDFAPILKDYPNPVQFCDQLQKAYLSGMPEIKGVYWPETRAMINHNRIIITPMGRRRMFMGRLQSTRETDALYRDAYAHRPQSHVGDVINRAFHLGDEVLPEDECYPLLQVHDEIDWMCRVDCVLKHLPTIKQLLEYPVKFPGLAKPLVIQAEITVGSNWFDQKEVPQWLSQTQNTIVESKLMETAEIAGGNEMEPASSSAPLV